MVGTGTNIIAALNCGEGRRGIGIEIDPVTYDKARANVTARDNGQSGRQHWSYLDVLLKY